MPELAAKSDGSGKAEQSTLQLGGRKTVEGAGASDTHSWKTLRSHRMQGDSSGRAKSSPMAFPPFSLHGPHPKRIIQLKFNQFQWLPLESRLLEVLAITDKKQHIIITTTKLAIYSCSILIFTMCFHKWIKFCLLHTVNNIDQAVFSCILEIRKLRTMACLWSQWLKVLRQCILHYSVLGSRGYSSMV